MSYGTGIRLTTGFDRRACPTSGTQQMSCEFDDDTH